MDTLSKKIRTVTESSQNPESLADRLGYLQKYEQMLDDPKYQETAPVDQQKSLKEAIDKAKSGYGDEKKKNEWLEVAQQLGRAGTQFAAASAGKDSRDMSNLDFGKGIDYGARTNSAFEEYRQATRDAAGLGDVGRQANLDQNAVKKSEFGKRAGMYKEGLDALNTAERNKKVESIEQRSVNREQKQDSKHEADESYRRADSVLRDQEKDLEGTAKSAQQIQDATTQLFNQLESDGAGKKALDAWEKQNPGVAKAAGIDLKQLQSDLTSKETAPRIFGGKSTEEDNVAKKTIIDQYKDKSNNNLKTALDKLGQLRRKRQEMASGKLAPDQALQSDGLPPPSTDPKIEQYAKQYNLTYDQATAVLTKRGYKPNQ